MSRPTATTPGRVTGRTPVIVAAETSNDFGTVAEPVDLMATAARAALDSIGAPLGARLDWIRVPWGVWPYRDPGRLVADRIGADRARTTKTTVGGNQVFDLVIDSASRIVSGEADVIAICGAETQRSRGAAKRAGHWFEYLAERPDASPDEMFGSATPLSTEAEHAVGVDVPVVFYALAESALRFRRGESTEQHRRRIASMWHVGARVAAENPHAWLRDAPSAEQIATASATNRTVTAPYTKLMTSNPTVNQGGAAIMCSVEVARGLGIPTDRWIFPLAGSSAHDPAYMTNRWALDESPAIRHSGRDALMLAGRDIDDCAMIDLYSCFPSAVQVAQRELAVSDERVWTITGGLTFAAGPLNCYCLLSLARAVELLRDAPHETAFLTGNGGFFSKHSFVVLSGTPGGFATRSLQHVIDAEPTRPSPLTQRRPSGDGSVDVATTSIIDTGTVEAATVQHDRDGTPTRTVLAVLDPQHRRHFFTSTDQTLITHALDGDLVGGDVPDVQFDPRQ